MKAKKMLMIFLIQVIVIANKMPEVMARTYTNDDFANEASNYSVDTTYEAIGYKTAVETYNIDLSWDDFHWVYVYEGEIDNPNTSIWIAKEYYDDANMSPQEIIADINNWKDKDKREITITNNSGFAVNVSANIENKTNENYANSANLQIASFDDANMSFSSSANVTNLTDSSNVKFVVKPTSQKYVNNTGTIANVTGELNLIFSKYNG